MPALSAPTPPDRLPGGLAEPGGWAQARRRAAAPASALLVLLLLLGACWATADGPAPRAAREVVLAGPRSPAPLGVVLLLDVSGSFAGYESIRRLALEDLLSWSTANLRDDDAVTVLAFAGDAAVVLPPTTIAALRTGPPSLRAVNPAGAGTEILPAIDLAAGTVDARLPQTVVAVTDTAVSDADPARADAAVRRLGATSMTLIVPDGVKVTGSWQDSFGYEHVLRADAGSRDRTSLAIAEAIAHATGQTLRRR